MKMRTIVVALVLSSLASISPSECASKQKPLPQWITDLRDDGFFVDDFSPPGTHTANRQITFGSNSELVVANDANTSFSHPGPVTGFVVDVSTGNLVNKVVWQGKSFPYIFSTHSGGYAVNTETGLALYSPGLRRVVASVPYGTKLASPDGTSFAAWKRIPGPHGLTYFLDSETLQPTGVEYLDKSVDTICQDRIAYTPIIKSIQAVRVLGPSGVVSTYSTDCSEPRPNFLSTSILAVTGCDRVDVIDTSRGLLFSHPTEAYHTAFAATSRDGSRIVIAERFYGRGHEPKLRFERFTVLDIDAHASVFTTEVKYLRGRTSGATGAALSPDGALLAINSLGVVQLFNIPKDSKDHEQQ